MPAAKLSSGLYLGIIGNISGYEETIIKLCSRFRGITLICVSENKGAEKLAYKQDWGIARISQESILDMLSNMPNRALVMVENDINITSKCSELNIPYRILKKRG